jgi:uncharacterized protein YdeI (YjbR/CyaY-like superfamily)
MNAKVDKYLIDGCMRCKYGATPKCKVHRWHNELEVLRGILLEAGFTEELKWGMPCYTIDGKNVLILSAFKDYTAINFFKGALMKDPYGILTAPSENTQAARQYKVTSVTQLVEHEPYIKAYLQEAIAIERTGQKVELKKTADYPIPEELQQKFDEMPALKTAFNKLTPGRQRAYILYFAQAKQSATREARIEKYIEQMLNGKGLND